MSKLLYTLLHLVFIAYASTSTLNQPRFLSNDLTNIPTTTEATISDDPDFEILYVQPTNGTCGCANVQGNCTCDSASLSCNISFFDGTWGILPYGANVNYTEYSGSGPVKTETYLCPIDYDPPLIIPTICVLIGICFLILLCLDKAYKPAYLSDGPFFVRAYRYATTIHTFWPAVHLAITMGYLYYLLNNQSFTPYITGASGASKSYIVLNTNWYINNPDAMNGTKNYTVGGSGAGILEINGQNCIVQETQDQDYSAGSMFPSYPGVAIFLILSLVHIFHSIAQPDSKKVNYIIYSIATGVNMTTASWTWEVWDTCYALLPEYDADLFMVYAYLAVFETVCLVLVFVVICCKKDNWQGYVVCIGILMGLGGFVFKILSYFQLAIRYYPKVMLILDAVYHSQFIVECISCFKR